MVGLILAAQIATAPCDTGGNHERWRCSPMSSAVMIPPFSANNAVPRAATGHNDVVWREWVPVLAMCFATVPVSAFFDHIAHVVEVAPIEAMVWPYARWVVATMKEKVGRVYALDESIGHTMANPEPSKSLKVSISIAVSGTSPDPTWSEFRPDRWTVFVNARPKPFSKRGGILLSLERVEAFVRAEQPTVQSQLFSPRLESGFARFTTHTAYDITSPCPSVGVHEREVMKSRPAPAALDTMKITAMSVADMLKVPVPLVSNWKVKPTLDIAPFEDGLYALTAYVRLVKLSTDDGDEHIQLSDSPTASGNEVIAEIPCSQPQARADLAAILGFEPSPTPARYPRMTGGLGAAIQRGAPKITVVGYGFFDLSHQSAKSPKVGHAHGTKDVASLFEIHPIFKVTRAQ